MIAGALTAAELAYLRRNSQGCDLFLAVLNPATVYTARLNGAPASNDKVYEITYDGGAGVLASVKPGMSLWVGTSAGAYDVGIVRIRKTPGAATFYIGEESEIAWVDDQFLTVVNEFAIWPKHLWIDPATDIVYMDHDVAYTNQHTNCNPVVVMGPSACLWLTGASVALARDASSSWVIGSAIASYSWACVGAAIVGGATATPTITFSSAGTYLLTCTVTATSGASAIGYRYVFVYNAANMPVTGFQLESCSGEYQAGGWTYRITAWDEVTRTTVRDRALCILFARDKYGADEVSIGPIPGNENIIAAGWIAGESIVWDPNIAGRVTFEVKGPQYWLGAMSGFPAGIEDYDGAPTAWTEFNDLTIRKGVWHFVEWRTTATLCTDIILTSDTRQVAAFDAPLGNLLDQITSQADNAILAKPLCDRYGRLYCHIDEQYVPFASRTAPTVQDILSSDWCETIDIERAVVNEAGLVDSSGVAYNAGVGTPLFSLSPGHVFCRYGQIDRRERLALSGQVQANTLAGLLLGHANNEYPSLGVQFANHRAFDIAPPMFGRITITAPDTPRGIVETNMRMLPRRVSFRHDPVASALTTEIGFEAETFEALSVNGEPPIEPPAPPPPPEPPIPIEPPTPVLNATEIIFGTEEAAFYSADALAAVATPHWVQVEWPAGVGANPDRFDALSDGTMIFVSDLTGVYVWRSTDFRTSPAAPNWTLIIQHGDVVDVGWHAEDSFKVQVVDNVLYAAIRANDALDATHRMYYGVFNSIAETWAWTYSQTDFFSPADAGPFDGYIAEPWGFSVRIHVAGVYATFDDEFNAIANNYGFQNGSGGTMFRVYENGGTWGIRDISGHVSYPLVGTFSNSRPKGQLSGDQKTVVNNAGVLYVADSAFAFGARVTWGADSGIVLPIPYGYGSLTEMVWVQRTIVASSDFIHISHDGFNTTGSSILGDFWSIAALTGKGLVNVCLMDYV